MESSLKFVGLYWYRQRLRQQESTQRMILGRLKSRITSINDNVIHADFAPSVAEADAILAKFGYVDKEVEAIAA